MRPQARRDLCTATLRCADPHELNVHERNTRCKCPMGRAWPSRKTDETSNRRTEKLGNGNNVKGRRGGCLAQSNCNILRVGREGKKTQAPKKERPGLRLRARQTGNCARVRVRVWCGAVQCRSVWSVVAGGARDEGRWSLAFFRTFRFFVAQRQAATTVQRDRETEETRAKG